MIVALSGFFQVFKADYRSNWESFQLITTTESAHFFFDCDWQVIAAARQGYKAHGYELNQWLVWYSRLQARLQGLNKRATFSRADLWKVKSGKLAAIYVSVVEGILLQNLVEGIVMSSSLVTLNPLLTKLVCSRRLDIGFVLFLCVHGPRLGLSP